MEKVLKAIRRAARKVERLAGQLERPLPDDAVTGRPGFRDHPRPVLLIHGWFGSRRTFEALERRLRRDGYGVFTLDLGGLRGSIVGRGVDDLADLVRAKIERIYARAPGLGPLSIVGHSRGGLVAAYYVKRLGGWRRTRAVVTLGTAHRGIPLAALGLPFALVAPSFAQMTPGSPFLSRLHDGAWPGQVRLASIWSRGDAVSRYPSCVIETGGLPQLANVEVTSDHRGLLTQRKVYDALVRELRAAEEQAPTVRGPLTGIAGGRSRAAEAAEAARAAAATGAA